MTPLRRVTAALAGALATVGLVALPAAAVPVGAPGGGAHLATTPGAHRPAFGTGAVPPRRTVRPVQPKVDSSGRTTVYVGGTDRTALDRAVSSVGGRVTGALPGLVQAKVPAAALHALAGRQGVRSVRPPSRAVPDSVTSEGVAQSGADAWQAVGTGAGVKVGVVDAGFAGLAAAQAAGELPAGLTVTHENNCEDPTDSVEPHGTAVTEIVHDMAPDAQLVLVCIGDSVDLGTAATFLHDQGVSVVNMSLTFPDVIARGDGTGEVGDIIKRSRQQGLLWSVAAGNNGEDHLGGTLADSNRNGFLEFSGGIAEEDAVTIGAGAIFTVGVRWEAWPTTTTELDVALMAEPRRPVGLPALTDPDLIALISPDRASPGAPAAPDSVGTLINPNPFPVQIFLFVRNVGNPAGMHFDLDVTGDVSPLQFSTPGGSVGEPATSPYAMAVGAACVRSRDLEPFSSQGPTIDGRTKPDITAYDGVSTATFGPGTPGFTCQDGFLGTSAAAPHVTGAAALVKSANPSMDAAQIENYLEQHAVAQGTVNQYGHGLLDMGPLQVPQVPEGAVYQPLATPQRILDTRGATGGHQGKLGPTEQFTLTVPGLASDATAVAINLTGTGATTDTHLDVFPATYTGTSTLNLTRSQDAAVFTMVALGPNHTIKIRNEAGQSNVIVDLLGQFSPSTGATFVPNNPPARLMDTRNGVGGHLGMLGPDETFALQVAGVGGVPADATAVIVNVTGVSQTTGTFLSLFPDQPSGTSTLNLQGRPARANLTAVGIGPDGKIRVHNAVGSVHVIVDLQGWFVPTGGARFVALDPTSRILDTRHGNGLRLGALGPKSSIEVQGSELYGVPYDATAVAFNLTAVSPSTLTFLTVWPTGLARPGTSNLNISGGVVPNAVVAGTGTDGTVSLFNEAGSVHAVADIYGYFIP